MFFRPKRSSRSVDYLLSALSPLEVSEATRAYLGTLSGDELQALVERSVARMDDDERAYLAISPDFATFLEQNHRALRTLDHDALREILMPVIVSRSAAVEGTEDESSHRVDELSSALRAALPPLSAATAWRRLTRPAVDWFAHTRRGYLAADASLTRFYRSIWLAPARGVKAIGAAVAAGDRALTRGYRRAWPVAVRLVSGIATACAVVAAGAAVALLLIAVVIPAGRTTMAWIQAHPAHIAFATAPHAPLTHRTAAPIRVAARPAPQKIVVARHTAPPATPKPTAPPTAKPTAKPSATPAPRRTAAPVRIASTTGAHHGARKRVAARAPKRSHARVIAGTLPSHEAPLVQRARLIVMSYLDSLMRGDASSALGNLGLSASAGTSNLTEAPILAGATEFRVVRAGLTEPGSAKVQVVIDSPQGRFFGDYIVSANGPAAWITQHEVIPVESTVARHR